MPAAAGSRAPTPRTTSPDDRSRSRYRFAGPVRPTRGLVRCGRRLVLDDDPIADAADGHDLRATRGRHLRAQPRKVWLEPEQIRIGLGRPAGACQLEVRDDVAAGS